MNLVGVSVRSMKSDYAGGLPGEFSTRSRLQKTPERVLGKAEE